MIKLLWTDSEGDDQAWDFPHKNILCWECEGEGKIEEQGKWWSDPIVSRTCDCCKGVRVLKVVNEEKFDAEDKEKYKEYQEAQKRNAEFLREWQSEARHGA